MWQRYSCDKYLFDACYVASAFPDAWGISVNKRTRLHAYRVYSLVEETENKMNKVYSKLHTISGKEQERSRHETYEVFAGGLTF